MLLTLRVNRLKWVSLSPRYYCQLIGICADIWGKGIRCCKPLTARAPAYICACRHSTTGLYGATFLQLCVDGPSISIICSARSALEADADQAHRRQWTNKGQCYNALGIRTSTIDGAPLLTGDINQACKNGIMTHLWHPLIRSLRQHERIT